jgi:hypothetical protein
VNRRYRLRGLHLWLALLTFLAVFAATVGAGAGALISVLPVGLCPEQAAHRDPVVAVGVSSGLLAL